MNNNIGLIVVSIIIICAVIYLISRKYFEFFSGTITPSNNLTIGNTLTAPSNNLTIGNTLTTPSNNLTIPETELATTRTKTRPETTKDAKELQEQIQKAISLRIEIQNRIQQLQREKIQVPVYGTDIVSQQINKLTADLGKLDTVIAELQTTHVDLIGQYFINLAELQSGIKGTKNVVISDVKDGVLNIYNPFII